MGSGIGVVTIGHTNEKLVAAVSVHGPGRKKE